MDGAGDSQSKIRIRMGDVEVEYEGPHSFLGTELPKLIATLTQLRPVTKSKQVDDKDDDDEGADDEPPASTSNGSKSVQATVGAIAAKLGVKSGPDLIIAAAAKLSIVDGLGSFARKDLLKAMRSATNYFKKTYRNNLSQYLK